MKRVLFVIMILSLASKVALAGGGEKKPELISIKDWIGNNMSYPESAIDNKEEGVVYVSFSVNINGYAENIEIEEGVSESLNNEAIRVVSSMPFNLLEEVYVVGDRYILPINFKIK